jgi:hypothetical protein
MFSSTLKRPAATLAVAAGLLAAAGPAGAIQFGGDGNYAINVKAAPQGVLITNGTADDQMTVVPYLSDNQAVAGPRAHGSDVKPWQTTHQGGSASFMR